MKYIVEESLSNFNAWSGGKDTKDELTEEQLSQVEDLICEMFSYDNPPTDTQINDFLRFELISSLSISDSLIGSI